MTEEELYNMGIHETVDLEKGVGLIRVIGGWVYSCYEENGMGGFNVSSVFVPEKPKVISAKLDWKEVD